MTPSSSPGGTGLVPSASESLRAHAVALGEAGDSSAERELEGLLKSDAPSVRRAAASACGKLIVRSPDLRRLLVVPLASAAAKETRPQVLQYLLKALRRCADVLMLPQLDVLQDIARNPSLPAYVRDGVSRRTNGREAGISPSPPLPNFFQ